MNSLKELLNKITLGRLSRLDFFIHLVFLFWYALMFAGYAYFTNNLILNAVFIASTAYFLIILTKRIRDTGVVPILAFTFLILALFVSSTFFAILLLAAFFCPREKAGNEYGLFKYEINKKQRLKSIVFIVVGIIILIFIHENVSEDYLQQQDQKLFKDRNVFFEE